MSENSSIRLFVLRIYLYFQNQLQNYRLAVDNYTSNVLTENNSLIL
jgi:hypothetical protein